MSAVRIAVVGKGGTGKTTTSALIIRELVKRGQVPVLAVDADPNTNLAESLGTPTPLTIGSVLADFLDSRMSLPASMEKEGYLKMKIEESLAESKNVDFLVMGRKAGSGCYCVPNTILKNYIEKLLPNYKYVFIDNEAGMEHLSRKTVDDLDIMIYVSDHSTKGLRACARIGELANELGIQVKRRLLIVNRYRESDADVLAPMIEAIDAEKYYTVPDDSEIVRADAIQTNFLDLPDTLAAVQAISAFVDDALGLAAAAGAR